MQNTVTRRGFVAGSALAGMGAVASKALATETSGAAEITWDMESDLVIVGGGGAGMMAALAASEKGVSSIVVEKAGHMGGDTAICAQIFIGYNPEATLADSGEVDDFDTWLADQKAGHPFSRKGMRGEDLGDTAMVELQASLTGETYAWLRDVAGVEWVPNDYCHNCWTPQPGWDSVYPRDWIASSRVTPWLDDMISADDNIEVLTSTRVFEIVCGDDGRVQGVRALAEDGSVVSIRATRAVVVASGSFNGDRDMVGRYLGANESSLSVLGSTTNTGDGHRMVEQIGGTFRDMDLGTAWFPAVRGSETLLLVYSQLLYGKRAGKFMPGIQVNHDGVRYVDENIGYNLGGLLLSAEKWREAFYVADAAGAAVDDEGSLFSPGIKLGDDNILVADTLEELAIMMNVPADAFMVEVAKYNGYVDAGEDPDFGKALEGCARIETAPFYAIPLKAQPYNATFGGIAVDADGRVIDTAGEAIPGLFAAGICTGSFAEQAGMFYLGGFSQALVFGRHVGQKAADEVAVA